MKQSKNLIKPLQKSVNFDGVREFDNNEIQNLHSQERPNCWSLPVVTLTSIAISFPNITDRKSNQLLVAVSEGLYFAKLIEKSLDGNGDLTNNSKVADAVLVGVELYKRWQDEDLQKADLKGKTLEETLQKLSDIAEKIVTSFTIDTNNFLVTLSAECKNMALNNEKLVRVSSLVLMSTAMANFMESLRSMGDNEIMLNLADLGILVITIVVNVGIHIGQMSSYVGVGLILAEEIISIVSLLLLLVILCSSALVVPTAKRYIKSQYNQMHKRVSNDDELVVWGSKFAIDELRVVVRRYWVMIKSGSPQFVIACSVICITSGVVCLLMALTLLQVLIKVPSIYNFADSSYSNYKWSINWILVIQSIGLALGTIGPLLRWFDASIFKSSKIGHKSFKDELKVEDYWTQRLTQWRHSTLPLKKGHHKLRKLLHDTKNKLLNICILVQILTVLASKLFLLISAIFVKGLMFCFYHIKILKACDSKKSDDTIESKLRSGMEMDFSRYILLLEGEAELPKRTLKNICNEMDKLTQNGKMKQSKNLIKLLQKYVNFDG
ncbi:hypothetical protein DH2020_043275 [Rehmannia glutinosa]|uniref:Uncharacterized protein n=1 Tax=Rehmannia glutinosa TaxID=99300 RepID=A0ABR0UKK5_REHGL